VLVETRFVVATQAGMEMQSTVSSLTDDPDLGNNNAVTVFDVTAGRSTRQAGAWLITADVFSFLPGSGNTLAQGDILIGEHFKLSGADDAVEFNAGGIVQITGTLAYVMGDKDIVSGVYNVDAGGFLTFSQLDELNMDTIGGFDVGDATLTQVNFGSGRLAGQVSLDVGQKGDSQTPTMLLGMVMYPGDVLGSQPTEPFTIPYNAGNVLQLNNVILNTVNRAGAYRLQGSGTLSVSLPGNELAVDAEVLLYPDGTLDVTLGEVALGIHRADVVDTFLRFQDPKLDNDKLYSQDG